MSTRGRAKRPVLPNLAAAGRRTEKKEEPPLAAPLAERGNRRGQRGGQRGSRGSNARGRGAKTTVIQSDGIFAQGVGEGGSRTLRSSRQQGQEQIVGKIEGVDTITPIAERDSTGKPTRRARIDSDSSENDGEPSATYESEWISDNEMDQEAMRELCQSDFISDLKKGREAPVVLPTRDNDQFARLVRKPQTSNDETKKVKEEVKSPKISTPSTLEHNKNKRTLEEIRSDAAGILEQYIAGSSQLLHFQMPASLDSIKKAKNEDEKMDVDLSTMNEMPKMFSSETAPSEKSDSATQSRHCMDGLPAEMEIGKLQVMQSGKVRLVIGDRIMDVHPAIPSGLHETIVQVQTPQQQTTTVKPETSGLSQNGTVTTNGVQQPSGATVTVMGNVGHSLLCTYNVSWTRE
ncbi:hypothetical protein M3Y98_01077500 [Aphelenchoides besseyi]|nr:hypothetical protein M3Y98_01077500 [Aphelenchoides besseyi]KAI6209550.1 hypothetical protein M3Y96_00232900 [Aphelenchoides besseyi]